MPNSKPIQTTKCHKQPVLGVPTEMQVFRRKADLRRFRKQLSFGDSVGYVPTMGCLHEGHLSLVRAARKENNLVVVSIFVNPKQFEEHEDFQTYPRPIEQDKRILKNEDIDVLFLPEPSEFFGAGEDERIFIRSPLAKLYCGKSRPNHFDGVLKVLAKFLSLVRPSNLYMGAKDYQQFFLVRSMAKELDLDVDVQCCPTVRESGGLALSSRNNHLTEGRKRSASKIYKTLQVVAERSKKSSLNLNEIQDLFDEALRIEKSIEMDYICVVSAETLRTVQGTGNGTLILVAFYVDGVRLIDNIQLEGAV